MHIDNKNKNILILDEVQGQGLDDTTLTVGAKYPNNFIQPRKMGLLITIANASNHTKCLLFHNQKCMTQATLTNLHPHEYSQEFHYHPFAVKLDRYVGCCNT